MSDKGLMLLAAALIAVFTLLVAQIYTECTRDTEERREMRECVQTGARWDDCRLWVGAELKRRAER